MTKGASGSQGSWAGHRRARPHESHEMDTSDMGFEKAGETDPETYELSSELLSGRPEEQVTALLRAIANAPPASPQESA